MAFEIKIAAFLVLIGIYFPRDSLVEGLQARVYCMTTDVTTVYFRVKTDGDTSITGLQAHDPTTPASPSAPNPTPITDTGCTTTTLLTGTTDIYVLTFTSTECANENNNWLIKVLNSDKYYAFSCDNVQDVSASSGAVQANANPKSSLTFAQNSRDVKFQVVEAYGAMTPVSSVYIGQDIKFRLIYNKENIDGPDNFGYKFAVAYTQQAGTDAMEIQIMTVGLGTRVTITANLDGEEISQTGIVKRDNMYSVSVALPYGQTSSDANNWLIEERVIVIEALDDFIGVLVKGQESSYVANPIDVVGTKYRGLTLSSPADDGELVVMATETPTTVTITFNGYTPTVGDVIGSVVIAGGETDVDVTINEYHLIHIMCGSSCHELSIQGTAPIAVVYGNSQKGHAENAIAGDVMTQLTPEENFDMKFVLTPFDSVNGIFVRQVPDSATTVTYDDEAGTGTTATGNALTAAYSSLHIVDTAAAYYLHSEATSGDESPSLVPMAPVSEWGIYNFVYVRSGIKYELLFVGYDVGEIMPVTDMTGLFQGTKLSDETDFATVQNTFSLGSDSFDSYDMTIEITDGQEGMLEFRAGNRESPFLLMVRENTGSYTSSYLGFGTRQEQRNPCVASSSRPGDGIDSDCDGLPDAQDGEQYLQTPEATGIVVDQLQICASMYSCSDVLVGGCYNDAVYDSDDHFAMSQFVPNTGLSSVFKNYYVLDTSIVNGFKYLNSDEVIAVAVYKMCFSDEECQPTCSTMKKRSADDEEMVATVNVSVLKNETVSDKKFSGSHTESSVPNPCTDKPVFWVPVTLLLSMIVLASVFSCFFAYKRSRFMKQMDVW